MRKLPFVPTPFNLSDDVDDVDEEELAYERWLSAKTPRQAFRRNEWFESAPHGNIVSEILPGRLWQSGCITPSMERDIERAGINVVVNLYGDAPVKSRPQYPLTEITWRIFDASIQMVDMAGLHRLAERLAYGIRSHGDRVLVHCQAGLNRSGLLVGLVMWELGFKGHIVGHIRRCRLPEALCNGHFAQYLDGLTPKGSYSKRYLRSDGQPPCGEHVFHGARGGRYYLTEGVGGGPS